MHALNLEHAQSTLCLFADAHWLELACYDHYCVCAHTIVERLFLRLKSTITTSRAKQIHLHHIWDTVLLNTSNVKISNDNGHAHRISFSGHAQSISPNRHVYRTIGHTRHAQISEHVQRGVKKDPIAGMIKIELTNIPGIVYPDVDFLLYGPG